MNIKNFFKHLKTVCKHKFFVAKFCFKAGLYWQGIVHDLSKFSPTEFIESVKYYQGTRSPIDACKEENGMSMAWLHHKGRNKHHYEYWQDNFDRGTTHLTMPFKYAHEMICDYLGAGNAYMGKKFTLAGELQWWYGKNANGHIAMSEPIWHFCDDMMHIMAEENNFDVLRQKRAKKIYDKNIKKYGNDIDKKKCA